ncbi:hypothetical protein DXA13_15350 [Clostridium sp. AM58-1XD]|nr:hypothetical protein DXA13_15350 [Clostridium sp. AM58-1XD]
MMERSKTIFIRIYLTIYVRKLTELAKKTKKGPVYYPVLAYILAKRCTKCGKLFKLHKNIDLLC